MATYNGERYLVEQIDSILNQKNVEVNLQVRDDGSSDSTMDILEHYSRKGLIQFYQGMNLGPARSFMQLLRDSSDAADYYAFADQDDFWLTDKMKVACQYLMQVDSSTPALYFCQTKLVDENLKPFEKQIEINPKMTFGESLVYEFIGGCTMVMNKQLRNAINSYNPSYLPMHDVWIYSVALAIGAKVFFDKTPHMLYRQHGRNVIGQGYSRMHEWKQRMHRLCNSEHSRSRRAKEIMKGYEHLLSSENKCLLQNFIKGKSNLLTRLSLMKNEQLLSSNLSTNYNFKLALLLNTY